MDAHTHPLAPHSLPRYIPGADGSDPLFSAVVVLLIIVLMALGTFYLKLHSLPERMAHRGSSTQLQLIAVLAVLALFTHNNVFWVAALLLAVVRLPDWSTPINSIAGSLSRIAQAAEKESSEKASPALESSAKIEDK